MKINFPIPVLNVICQALQTQQQACVVASEMIAEQVHAEEARQEKAAARKKRKP